MVLTKLCKHCKEIIKSEATRCEYCGGRVLNDAQELQLHFKAGLLVVASGVGLFFLFGGGALLKFIPLIAFAVLLVVGIINAYSRV